MKQVTMQQVKEWLNDHYTSKHSFLQGMGSDYEMRFEDGSTYEYKQVGDAWNYTITITLDSKYENVTVYKYSGFGVKAISENGREI